MVSRRRFFTFAAASGLAAASRVAPTIAEAAGDAPILGAPTGEGWQAVNWLAARASGYTPRDVETIVTAYAQHGEATGVDWFLAVAQMAHETGSLTSWWCQRPRRNPAGIGVTSATRAGSPNKPPGPGWVWDGARWREGWSFPVWADASIPAHLGRLLAYVFTDSQANDTQRAYIHYALSFRSLPASLRGCAQTITGLNGKWAVPGRTYGQSIMSLAQRMRG